MNAVVIVLQVDNPEGTRRAAAYMRSVWSQMKVARTYVVVPPDMDDKSAASAAASLGVPVLSILQSTPLEAVVEVLRVERALEAEQGRSDLLHVFRSDVQVSPLWADVTGAPEYLGRFPVLGPVGVQFEGGQRAELPDGLDPANFSAACNFQAQRFGGRCAPVDYVDPVAFALHVQAVADLGGLDPDLKDLGWALRDLCLRVRQSWRWATHVVQGAYATILDPKRLHGHGADAEGRIRFYAKHGDHTQQHHTLAATFTVDPQNRQQLHLLRRSIESVCGRVDVVQVALVGHPKGFLDGPGPRSADAGNLQLCMGNRDLAGAAEGLQEWLNDIVSVASEKARRGGDKVRTVPHVLVVEHWPDEQGLERLVIQGAHRLGCTWALQMAEGDVLESGVDAEELQRLMKHPDPMVFAYDVGICTSWGTRDLIRIDPPFGDGGDLTGDPPPHKHWTCHDWRLHRTDGPRIPTEGGRISHLRLIATQLEDPEQRPAGLAGDAMTIAEWVDDTSLGLFLLAYSGENPDDVARWLDWTYGLTDHPLIGWTEDASTYGPVMLGIERSFNADVVNCGGEGLHFAAWRNQCIDVMSDTDPKWLATVDPDEWYTDPTRALLSWRQMTASHTRLAYPFRFESLTPQGVSTTTNTRMWRSNLGLRYVGRVHETFDGALAGVRGQYGPQAVTTAPHTVRNRGAGDPETAATKRELYHRLIRKEVQERPDRAQPLVLLSYIYGEQGHHAEELACLQRAVELAPRTADLPAYALGVAHARHAKRWMQYALRRIPPEDPRRENVQALVGWLQALPDPAESDGSEPAPLPWLEAEDAQVCGGGEGAAGSGTASGSGVAPAAERS